jgi:hypothetical protein
VEHVIKLLLTANNDLLSIEQKCQDLKREEAALTAKNLNAAGTFQQLSNDISEISNVLDRYRTSCEKERLELDKVRLQKIGLESIIRQFKDNNESFQRIKEFVRQTVELRLMNHRHVLLLALQSIIESYRRDPIKFSILYHNLSAAAITETRLAEFDQIDQNNFGLSSNEQLCYQHENPNDIDYWKFLVDEAEIFFKQMVNELKPVCINRLVNVFTSASFPSQLTKNSGLVSEVATSMQLFDNKKIQSANRNGYDGTLES